MALRDELAWVSATELAPRIRRRELSPVEVVDAFIERIEARNPTLNAFVYQGFDDARGRARAAEKAVMAGEELGPLHGVPRAIKDLFDFKPGWRATFGGIRALKDFVIDPHCVFAERIEQAGAILSARPTARSWASRHHRQLPLRTDAQPVRPRAQQPAARRAAALPPSPTAWCRSPRAPTAAARSASRRPGAASTASRPSFGRVPFVVAAQRLRRDARSCSRARSRAPSTTPRSRSARSPGYDPRDPYASTSRSTSSARRDARSRAGRSPTARTSTSSRSIAGSPRWSPARSAPSRRRAPSSRRSSVGIERSQHELCDLWCRLITPAATRRVRAVQGGRHRSAARPRDRSAAAADPLARARRAA